MFGGTVLKDVGVNYGTKHANFQVIFIIELTDMSIKYSTKHIAIDKAQFTKEDYNYIDPDMLSETHYRFEFPTNKPDENGDILI